MDECTTCEGDREIVIGKTRGSMYSPPEPITAPCPECGGGAPILTLEEAESLQADRLGV